MVAGEESLTALKATKKKEIAIKVANLKIVIFCSMKN
jgi:hypothetical protein